MSTLRRVWPLLPLAVALGLMTLFAAGLRHDPRQLPSALLGQPAPTFSAARLGHADQVVTSAQMRDQPWVLNVWASWCTACADEHEAVKQLATGTAPVYGLNYKDAAPQAQAWLARMGDPYRASIADPDGRIGMDFGVYGLPETFVIDREGRVRFRHAGPLTKERVERELLPLLKSLRES